MISRSRSPLRFDLLICASLATLSACAHVAVRLPQADPAALRVDGARESAECELHLQVVVPVGGVDAVSSENVCIKRVGESVAIPSPIYIQTAENKKLRRDMYCQDSAEDEGAERCAWSNRFYDRQPTSFRLSSRDGVPLAQVLRMVRVHRNGRLVYRWTNDSSTLGATATELTVDGDALTSDGMPHDSELGLYVAPVGIEIDEAVLTQEIQNHRDLLAQRLRRVAQEVALGANSPLLTPALRRQLSCLTERINYARLTTVKLLEGLGAATTSDAAELARLEAWFADSQNQCALPATGAEVLKEIGRLYDDLRNHKLDLGEVEDKLDELVSKAAAELGLSIDDTSEQLKRALIAWHDGTPAAQNAGQLLKSALDDVDALVAVGKSIVGSLPELHENIKERAISIATDPEQQFQLFQAAHGALGDEEDLFETRADNPLPVAGETILAMSYQDMFQVYFLAAWNGVPVPVNEGNRVRFELRVENLIPLIDVVGVRWQFSRSNYTELRLGLGAGMVREKQLALDDEGLVTTEVRDSDFNVMPQANLSFAGFKLGVGIIVGRRLAAGEDQVHNLRVILGADLVSLIAGTDVDAGSVDLPIDLSGVE